MTLELITTFEPFYSFVNILVAIFNTYFVTVPLLSVENVNYLTRGEVTDVFYR
jgi:hypothetical protein